MPDDPPFPRSDWTPPCFTTHVTRVSGDETNRKTCDEGAGKTAQGLHEQGSQKFRSLEEANNKAKRPKGKKSKHNNFPILALLNEPAKPAERRNPPPIVFLARGLGPSLLPHPYFFPPPFLLPSSLFFSFFQGALCLYSFVGSLSTAVIRFW